MLSKQGHLNDQAGNWHPHLMFFIPDTDPEAWGAGLPGSPVVVGDKDTLGPFTLFMVPVEHWSRRYGRLHGRALIYDFDDFTTSHAEGSSENPGDKGGLSSIGSSLQRKCSLR